VRDYLESPASAELRGEGNAKRNSHEASAVSIDQDIRSWDSSKVFQPSDSDGCDPLKRLVPAQRLNLDRDGPSVSVVIPALNEAKNLSWLARHMPAGIGEMILVDGGSTDETVPVARTLWPDLRILEQTRRGKGNALACGFAAATNDIIVMIDADGSMDPGEIPFFVDALVSGSDYAKGTRFGAGGGSNDITLLRTAGNRVLNGLTNLTYRSSYSDLCYGYNAFWREVLPAFQLDAGRPGEGDVYRWGDGFEIETLMNIRAHIAGLRVEEVPSFESRRINGASNLNATKDGLRVLRTIAVERWGRRRSPLEGSLHAHRALSARSGWRTATVNGCRDRGYTRGARPLPIEAGGGAG
jgi:hypothetical protein